MVHRIFSQKFWHELFEAGVFLKAVNGVWETGVGFLLLVDGHTKLPNVFVFDLVSEHLDNLSESTRNFVGLYLFFHGLLNMFLAYNLYRDRLWAYPAAMAFSGLFLIYQVYKLAQTHSLILLLITIFDIAFIALTWHEWRYQHHKRQTS